MGWLIVAIVLVLIGIIAHYEFDIFGFACFYIGFVIFIVMGVCSLIAQTVYTKMPQTKEFIEYCVQTDNINVSVYNDTLTYNKRIRLNKKYHDNFWIGSLFNDKIAKLDYIDLRRQKDGKGLCSE